MLQIRPARSVGSWEATNPDLCMHGKEKYPNLLDLTLQFVNGRRPSPDLMAELKHEMNKEKELITLEN